MEPSSVFTPEVFTYKSGCYSSQHQLSQRSYWNTSGPLYPCPPCLKVENRLVCDSSTCTNMFSKCFSQCFYTIHANYEQALTLWETQVKVPDSATLYITFVHLGILVSMERSSWDQMPKADFLLQSLMSDKDDHPLKRLFFFFFQPLWST